jgi:hypothetical protein
MEQSPPWDDNSRSAGQEIPRVLWDSKVHCNIHKSTPLVSTLDLSTPYPETHCIIILPHKPSSPKCSSPSRFPN